MKRKIIALTVATAVSVATFSIAGCADSASAPRAMTENEWKAAWQATCAVTNFTMKQELSSCYNAKVLKADYESGNYVLPDVNQTAIMITSTDLNKQQVHFITNTENTERNEFNVAYENTVYTIGYDDNNLKIIINSYNYESEEQVKAHFHKNSLDYVFNTLAKQDGIYLENSYSSFSYNGHDNTYFGTLMDSENKPCKLTIKFYDGRLSEYTSDIVSEGSFSFNEGQGKDDIDYVQLNRTVLKVKFYDIDKTVPISDEVFAKISALIKD